MKNIGLGILLVIVAWLIISLNNQYNKAVNDCINAGNSVAICESGLR